MLIRWVVKKVTVRKAAKHAISPRYEETDWVVSTLWLFCILPVFTIKRQLAGRG